MEAVGCTAFVPSHRRAGPKTSGGPEEGGRGGRGGGTKEGRRRRTEQTAATPTVAVQNTSETYMDYVHQKLHPRKKTLKSRNLRLESAATGCKQTRLLRNRTAPEHRWRKIFEHISHDDDEPATDSEVGATSTRRAPQPRHDENEHHSQDTTTTTTTTAAAAATTSRPRIPKPGPEILAGHHSHDTTTTTTSRPRIPKPRPEGPAGSIMRNPYSRAV